MANIIQRWKAKKRIPQEAYQLVDSIHHRYSQLNLDSGDFTGLSEREKSSKLINIINNDPEISRLNSLSSWGSIRVERQETGVGLFEESDSGLNLCIGENGLFIYNWDDFANKYDKVPANPDTLEKYFGRINTEELKRDITDYADRSTYVERVADFKKFI